MRIGILTPTQAPTDIPMHWVSKTHLDGLLQKQAIEKISVGPSSFVYRGRKSGAGSSDMKRFLKLVMKVTIVPKIKEPGHEANPSLMIQYPPPDFRTNALSERRRIWLSAKNF